MTYGSVAPKKRISVDEMLSTSRATRVVQKQKEDEFPDIKGNPFFSIMFDEKLSQADKKKEIASALVFQGTKEQNRQKIAEFEQFKEFLQANREQMASEIISLTNTETFAQLKSVYEDMNGGLIDFEDKMKPLMDILDAVYTLRSQGKTMDVFRSINDDRKRERELNDALYDLGADITEVEDRIRGHELEIAGLSEQRSFFGFGGITQEARSSIAQSEENIKQLRSKLDEMAAQKSKLQAQIDDLSNTGEFAEEKANLRKLLDISSDEHRQNQKALVEAATNFVSTSKERIGEVRVHLGDMSSKIENLKDNNQTLTRVYAILNESVKSAAGENEKIRSKFVAESPEEDLIAKMKREEEKMAVEEHIKVLSTTAVDTMTTFGDLTNEAIQIKSMKDNNDDQVNRAKTMHTQGVAGVASKLSVVLQAVSQAALGESSEMAKSTLHEMTKATTDIAKKEVIRAALGVNAQNEELQRAVDNLASFGDVISKSTEITKQGLQEMRGLFSQLETVAGDVQADIKEAVAASADVASGSTKEKKQTVKTSGLKV
jgi:chromosome segregation ATPase